MITKHIRFLLSAVVVVLSIGNVSSQEEEASSRNKELYRQLEFYNLRGTNALDAVVGSSLISGGFSEPKFETYFRIGYKRHVTEELNINITFNKYNLAFGEDYFQGFMSFDLNLEYLISPYSNISPFIFGGYGYNASNYFEDTGAKVQGGLGIEFIVVEKLGVKLFGDYNLVFSKEEDPLIVGESDISFVRVGMGINFYFGGERKKQRLLEEIDTVIKSNLIK